MTKDEPVTLENIKGGAAGELFAVELPRVWQNILDPNTETMTKRTIVLEIDFWPRDDERQVINCAIRCKTKLAPGIPVLTSISLDREKNAAGKLVPIAYEFEGVNRKQVGLFQGSTDELYQEKGE